MKASELQVGDRIRITSLPDESKLHYRLWVDTKRVLKKLIASKKRVRILEIDECGVPWCSAGSG